MKKWIFIFFFSTSCLAVQEYYEISRSLRAMGMGGAFYGLSDDEYALFYNPAGLAAYTGGGHLTLSLQAESTLNTLQSISTLQGLVGSGLSTMVNSLSQFSGNPMYAGVSIFPYFLKRNLAVGLLLGDTKVDMAIQGKDIDTTMDVTAFADAGIFLGLAGSLSDNFRLGVTSKVMYRAGGQHTYTLLDIAAGITPKLSDFGGGGGGVDFDIGATYDIPKLPFGVRNSASLVINNILASPLTMIYPIQGSPPGLVRTVSLGWHTVFAGVGPIDNFHILVDFAEFQVGGESDPDRGARSGTFFKHMNFGTEIPIKGWMAVRGGFHQGDWTAGLSFYTPVLKLEFATYGEEIASGAGTLTSRRYGVRLVFGSGSPPPAAVRSFEQERNVASEKTEKTEKKNEQGKKGPDDRKAAGQDSTLQNNLNNPPKEVDRFGIDNFIEGDLPRL